MAAARITLNIEDRVRIVFVLDAYSYKRVGVYVAQMPDEIAAEYSANETNLKYATNKRPFFYQPDHGLHKTRPG